MKNYYKIISLILLLIIPSYNLVYSLNTESSAITEAVKTSKDSVAINNDYVRVMRNCSLCTAANTSGFGTRVIVALGDLKIKSNSGLVKLKWGETKVFQANESYKAPKGEFFEIAFRLNYPPLLSPEEWIEPTKNEMVYEDKEFRIFNEILAPGDTRPLHSHGQRVVVKLNPARLTDPRFHPKGTTEGSLQTPNTIKYALPINHVVQNISDVPLFNIVVEFKIPVAK